MSLTLRYMQLADIQPVVAIDALCFEPPWSQNSYTFEIQESKVSHMVVLEADELPPERPTLRRDGWLAWLNGAWRGAAPVNGAGSILGYGGLWKVADEAHISTIATHPNQRRQGYGEILLAGMISKALRLRASYIVLEVRVSNRAAQELYQKYGFQRYARRRNYYQNNNEDAWDMRLTLNQATRRRFSKRRERLWLRHGFRDEYSQAARPRA